MKLKLAFIASVILFLGGGADIMLKVFGVIHFSTDLGMAAVLVGAPAGLVSIIRLDRQRDNHQSNLAAQELANV